MIVRCCKCDRTNTYAGDPRRLPLSDCCRAPLAEVAIDIEMGDRSINVTEPEDVMPGTLAYLKACLPLLARDERIRLVPVLSIVAADMLLQGRSDEEILDVYRRVLGYPEGQP